METIFFICIILFIIIGLIYNQFNKKENLSVLEKEKEFRKNQKNYYSLKQKKFYEKNCDVSNFVQLDNISKKLVPTGSCESFSNIKEGFSYGDFDGEIPLYQKRLDTMSTSASSVHPPSGETQYEEKTEVDCEQYNIALQKLDLDDAGEVQNFFSRLKIVNTDLINGKGCGYCYNEDDTGNPGKILYGDKLGPVPIAGMKPTCKTWLAPGEIDDGGGYAGKSNKWRSMDDPDGPLKFGGNQGIVDDAIKLHEQQICSTVKNCSDLTGPKSICGWCYMGRKGDGTGEGMVALEVDGEKTGETKYMDDYCPWPGETIADGFDDVKRKMTKNDKNDNYIWTGPNDDSVWLKKASKDVMDDNNVDTVFRNYKSAKESEKDRWKNKKAFAIAVSNARDIREADDKIYNITKQIEAIERIHKKSNPDFKTWKNAADTEDTDKLMKYEQGTDDNNMFLWKCNDNNLAELSSDVSNNKNIFFLNSYYELTDEQKIAFNALREAHSFYKKCNNNMKIMGKTVTSRQVAKCLDFQTELNKTENIHFKKIFMNIDLNSGCVENCNGTCSLYTFDDLKNNLYASNTDNSNNNLGDKISQAFRKIPFNTNNLGVDMDIETNGAITSIEDVLVDWVINKSRYQHQTDWVNSVNWKKGMRKLWRLFIDNVKKNNPAAFREDITLSKKIVLNNDSPALNNQTNIGRLKGSGYETPELKTWRNPQIGGITGSRLMLSNDECSKLEENFPCFVNWMGRKDISGNMPGNVGYDNTKPLGHNDACYDEMWKNYTIGKSEMNAKYVERYDRQAHSNACSEFSDPSAVGLTDGQKFRGAMSKQYNFDNDTCGNLIKYTIEPWDKDTIPNVRVGIGNIRKTADEGPQYQAIYDNEQYTGNSHGAQIRGSSKIMAMACYNDLPRLKDNTSTATGSTEGVKSNYDTMPFSCDDRFIKENKSSIDVNDTLRPKECTDHFWEKNTDIYNIEDTENRPITKLDSKYTPLNDNSWGNVWGMENLPHSDFADKIHYKKGEPSSLEQEGFTNQELNKNLHDMSTYVKNFRNKPTPTLGQYDKYLYYKRLVYGVVDNDDMIWKDLKPSVKISDVSGADDIINNPDDTKPWVKMCWGDFKNAMKRKHSNNISLLPTGNIELLDDDLYDIIKGKQNLTLKKILGEEINYEEGDGEITEQMYNRDWFPFWRFFEGDDGKKYYELSEYNKEEKAQRKKIRDADETMKTNYKFYKIGDNADDYFKGGKLNMKNI
jgi:hypothetical protein